MTRVRRQAASAPEDEGPAVSVCRGRLLASLVRGLMAVVTLAIVALAAQPITHGRPGPLYRLGLLSRYHLELYRDISCCWPQSGDRPRRSVTVPLERSALDGFSS